MLDIRVFSVLDTLVVHVQLIERNTLGTLPLMTPTFLGSAVAPLEEIRGPDGLARMVHKAISNLWDDADEFTHQLTC